MFRDLTRGGQITMHAIRMFGQVLRRLILWGSLLYIIVAGYYVYKKTIKYQWYLLGSYNIALLKLGLIGNAAKHTVTDPDGKVVIISAKQFVNNPFLKQQLTNLLSIVNNILVTSLKFAGICSVVIVVLLWKKGKLQKTDQGIRGALFLESKRLKRFLKSHSKCSDLNIAGVPLVKDSETKHILITGTTGCGKSVCMMEVMDRIRKRKERAILYDDSGTFIQHYYRKNRDIILNPLDERCPAWNIWQEAQDLADFEAIAASLMPVHLSGSDPFWINSARTIFATLAEKLMYKEPKTKSLLQPMFSGDLKLINELLRGTVAESLVNESVEKMALSIKSTLATYCKALLYLKVEKEPLFSIKRWLQDQKTDGWIFIASSAEKLEALKPLISVWLDIAARGILSLPQGSKRRIWFLIDELASLHRLHSLSLLLSQSRKFGGCVVTAFQDIHQLRAIYGRDEAEALLAMYNTNFCYRTKCPDTAHWMSRLTGQREIIEQREGFSYGANDIRDGVSVHQERRKEPLILDTEFLKLNDFEAYLVLPENTPVTKVTLTPKNRSIKSKALIPRKLEEVSLLNTVPPTTNKKDKCADEESKAKEPTIKKLQQNNQFTKKELMEKPKVKEVGFNQC